MNRGQTQGFPVVLLAAASMFGCSSSSAGRTGPGGSDSGISGTGGTTASGNGGMHSGGTQGDEGGGGTAGSGARGSGGTVVGRCSAGKPPVVGGCAIFSADDAWNTDVSCAPTDAAWTAKLLAMVGVTLKLHPDYGNAGTAHYGIPINVAPANLAKVPVTFVDYPDESDPGPYPFPAPGLAKIEGGTPSACDGDCHLLVIESGACQLYEGYHCSYSGGWHCSGGAKWDLTKNGYGQRPKGWTSADAAGLAIMPGLVRVDEVRAGVITHAIRFTTTCSRKNFVAPATHQAVPSGCSASDPNSPPMGLRVRLNTAKFDISRLSAAAQVVARAMQTYGMILADNGSNFYFQGEDDPRWADTDVEPLKTIPVSAFEVIGPPALEP